MFMPETFAEACGGHNPKDVAGELQKLGFLHGSENDRYRYKCTVRVNGESKRPRFYAVWDDLLEYDPTEEEPNSAECAGTDGICGTGDNYNNLHGPNSVPVMALAGTRCPDSSRTWDSTGTESRA